MGQLTALDRSSPQPCCRLGGVVGPDLLQGPSVPKPFNPNTRKLLKRTQGVQRCVSKLVDGSYIFCLCGGPPRATQSTTCDRPKNHHLVATVATAMQPQPTRPPLPRLPTIVSPDPVSFLPLCIAHQPSHVVAGPGGAAPTHPAPAPSPGLLHAVCGALLAADTSNL